MLFRLLNKTARLPLTFHFGLVALTFLWMRFAKGHLDASYAASQHPVDYATGQTGFDGQKIKEYYAAMTETGTLDIYVRTQLIDFGFILGMLMIGAFFATFIARLGRDGSYGRKIGLAAGASLILGATCDAIENGWSFAMLANPTDFADWLALPYSGFASVKFACITLGMALLIVCILFTAIGRLFKRPAMG